jgi:hypothetical protein
MRLRERIQRCYLIGVLLLIGCGPAKPNAKVIEQQLAKAVPLQSSPQEVLDYLNREKIEHSDYLRDGSRGHLIEAVVRDQSRWSIVKTSCGIKFRFGEDGRLLKYEVREEYTGP